MNQTNCHNCGAPITGPECEYCGTKFNIRVVEPEAEITIVYDGFGREVAKLVNSGLISVNEARRRIELGT